MPVHFAGQPCAMDELLDLARRHGAALIEDAAHALGAEYKGRKIGAIGDMTIFSFHPIKTITTGEGGMVVSRNKEWGERIRLLRFHGIATDAWQRHAGGRSPQYSIHEPGFKYTMMDLQAAIGIHQMDKLDWFIERRTNLVRLYTLAFQEIEGLKPLHSVPYPQRHAWHLFVVRLEMERLRIDRDRFLELLKEHNIGAGVHFPALHLQPYYQDKWGYRSGDFPNAERVSERILSLPLFPTVSLEDVKDVAEAVGEVLAEHLK